MNKKKMAKVLSLLLTLCLICGTVLGHVGGASVARADDTQSTEETTTTELTPITFEDLGMPDGMKTGSIFSVSTYWEGTTGAYENTIFTGKFFFHGTKESGTRTIVVFGGEKAGSWAGLQMWVANDGSKLSFNTGSITTAASTDTTSFWERSVTATSLGMTSFRNVEFKVAISFEKINEDLRLKIYINDNLITLGGEDTYIIKGAYSADKIVQLSNYMLVSEVGDGVTLTSCRPGLDNLAELTFNDFGLADTETSTSKMTNVEAPFSSLADTMITGTLTNYGLWYQFQIGNSSSFLGFYRSGDTSLQSGLSGAGTTGFADSLLNENEAYPDNNWVLSTEGIDFTKSVSLAVSIESWDYNKDGTNNDAKIGIFMNGKLLGGKHFILANTFDGRTGFNKLSTNQGGAFGIQSTPDTLPDNLRKVTLADFDIADGTIVKQLNSTDAMELDSLLNTVTEMNVKIGASTGGSQIHYAIPKGKAGDYGVNLSIASSKITVLSYEEGWLSTSYTVNATTAIQKDSFYDNEFKLGFSIELVDLGRDGANNDVRFGIWFNDTLQVKVYMTDKSTSIGTGMAIYPYIKAEEQYAIPITVSNPVETQDSFEPIGLEDINKEGVTPGTYDSVINTGLSPNGLSYRKNGSIYGKLFSTNVRFSDEAINLFYGGGTTTAHGWYGVWIGSNTGDPTNFKVQWNGGAALATIEAGIAGVKLYNSTFKLGISTRQVDSDGDNEFNDLEIGIWFNDRLYNNAYFYVADNTYDPMPNLAVYRLSEEGQVTIGDYIQETPTEVTHCADDFAYFADGDSVTVGGVEQGISWNTSKPGEYEVTYTEKQSTFKENVLIYKSNDVTADGKVNVVDLVAMKKLAGGTEEQKANISEAGKKSVNYVDEATFDETTVLGGMHAKLLESENKIQAKEFGAETLGALGKDADGAFNTWITHTGVTTEGTSVLSISDAENSGYQSDLTKLDGTGLDFVLDFDTDREIKVLQITDTQIIDSAQQRSEGRLSAGETTTWAPENMQTLLFDEMEKLFEEQDPDLVLITGDIIYGEFDDKGTSLQALVNFMDSYQIPWAPIFGNHDNETLMDDGNGLYGTAWQCAQFEKSPYCLFNRRNEIGGNGNYSIGISVNGVLQRSIFMMDSNGTSNANPQDKEDGTVFTKGFKFFDEQIAWYRTVAARVNEYANTSIPSLLCMHVTPAELTTALWDKGYQATADVKGKAIHTLDLGMDSQTGDFGFKNSKTTGDSGMTEFILPYLKAAGTEGVFFGHCHVNALSVEWEGIRWTYGLKTGQYDTHPDQRGGTMITLNNGTFDVEHIVVTGE